MGAPRWNAITAAAEGTGDPPPVEFDDDLASREIVDRPAIAHGVATAFSASNQFKLLERAPTSGRRSHDTAVLFPDAPIDPLTRLSDRDRVEMFIQHRAGAVKHRVEPRLAA